MSDKKTLNGIARQLVGQGLVTEELAMEAVAAGEEKKKPFLTCLKELADIDCDEIAQYLSADFGLPVYDLGAVAADSLPTEHIKEDLITAYNAVPIAKRGSRLFIAISDPTNSEPLDKYKFASGLSVEAVIVAEDKLSELRSRAMEAEDNLSEGLDDSFDLEIGDEDVTDTEEEGSDVDDTPIVRFVNKVLLDAIKRGASDIHVEPYEKIFRIRFRVDGVLEEVVHPPLNMATRLTARIKVMSRMDISERRIPQDGRIKLKLSKTKAIDFVMSQSKSSFIWMHWQIHTE